MRILIAGGSGYIDTRLGTALVARHHSVRAGEIGDLLPWTRATSRRVGL